MGGRGDDFSYAESRTMYCRVTLPLPTCIGAFPTLLNQGVSLAPDFVHPSDDKAARLAMRALCETARPSPPPLVERFLRQSRGRFGVGELRMFALRRLVRS